MAHPSEGLRDTTLYCITMYSVLINIEKHLRKASDSYSIANWMYPKLSQCLTPRFPQPRTFFLSEGRGVTGIVRWETGKLKTDDV